jgi:NTE family protein
MKKTKHSITLALQGGGAHGAYTWGVLDRLLEEDNIIIEGISGASAGAMNAVALAQGFAMGGNIGARETLAKLWRTISDLNSFSAAQRTPIDVLMGNWSLNNSPGYVAQELLSRITSPYQTNPLGINPLRDLIKQLVDFKALRSCKEIKLFISATNVRTGHARVFERDELTPDVLAASACLPTMYQAVKIGSDYYWDGGFMGNPLLWPLIYNCDTRDLMLVQINPLTRNKLPRTAPDIHDRMSEITFNASLISEMRAIAFVSKMLAEGSLDKKRYKNMLVHRVHSETKMDTLDASSKANTEWEFLWQLHEWGHAAASNWLKTHRKKLGKTSSVNIQKEYLS